MFRQVSDSARKAEIAGGNYLEALRVASEKTEEEVRAGTMLPGISLADLLKKFAQADGSLVCRAIGRFAVRQGTKETKQPNGSVRVIPKWRLIDD